MNYESYQQYSQPRGGARQQIKADVRNVIYII